MRPYTQGVAWCIWGSKVKIDYFVLDTKLQLINMKYVKKKKILNFIDKKFDKIFRTY